MKKNSMNNAYFPINKDLFLTPLASFAVKTSGYWLWLKMNSLAVEKAQNNGN